MYFIELLPVLLSTSLSFFLQHSVVDEFFYTPMCIYIHIVYSGHTRVGDATRELKRLINIWNKGHFWRVQELWKIYGLYFPPGIYTYKSSLLSVYN